jgi:hypothetical protein
MCSINRQIPLLIQRLGPPRPCRQPERGFGRGGFWDLGLERRGRPWGSSSLAAPGGITEGVLGSSPRAQTASPTPFPFAGSKTTPPGSRHPAGQHSSAGSASKAATGGSDGVRDVGGEDPVGGERGGEGNRAPSRAGSRGGWRAGTPRSAAHRGPVLLRLDELGVARGGAGGRVGQKRPLSELPGEEREDGEAGEGQQPGGETGQGGVELAEAPAAQDAAPRQTTSWLRRIFSRPA